MTDRIKLLPDVLANQIRIHARDEVFLRVVDGVGGAVLARERGLLRRTHGADEVQPVRLRHLAGDEAHAAGAASS